METSPPFPSGFPLHELPELTDEAFFAFHLQINKLIYVNAAFEAIWNIPRATISANASSLIDTVHPSDRLHVIDAFKTLQTDRKKQNIEFRIVLSDDTEKWIRVKAYLSEKNNNEVIVGIAEDITAFKNYSDTLHKFSDKKNSILNIVSHDLLGPLGNIELSATLLSDENNLTDDQRMLLSTIAENNRRGVSLIRDLLNDEFLQSSEANLVKQRIDLIEKLERLMQQYQKSPIIKPRQFIFRSSEITLLVNVDEAKFMQVIINLLSNAQKFTPDNGKIEISVEADEQEVIIEVSDNGIGIPKDLQPYIFDKFTKARRIGMHGEPTTGLGMSIIKTIVEWHQGKITFKSEEGKGTTFTIRMPRET